DCDPRQARRSVCCWEHARPNRRCRGFAYSVSRQPPPLPVVLCPGQARPFITSGADAPRRCLCESLTRFSRREGVCAACYGVESAFLCCCLVLGGECGCDAPEALPDAASG